MLPSKKQQQQHPWRSAEEKVRPQSAAVNWNVLAERTQRVVAVGAWVESAQDDAEQEENTVFTAAAQIEEAYKEQRKEKERLLKRFQEEVKHRVNQHIKMRRKHQLQKSYEAALKESSVVIGFSDSALQLTPKKSTCLYRHNTDSAICSTGNKINSVQTPDYEGDLEEKVLNVQFSEHANTVRKTVQQVRRRLASRKSMSESDPAPELPGGAWESRLSIQKPASPKTIPGNAEEGDRGEFLLVGHHDLPAELQGQEQGQRNKDSYYTVQFQKVNNEILKSTYPTVGNEPQDARVLWSGAEKEESKKQRQGQYLRYRRLFMDIEREQVKEQQRQKEWQRKMEKIKKEKELRRHAEEQRMQERQRVQERHYDNEPRIQETYQAGELKIQESASQGDVNAKGKAYEKLEHLKLGDMLEKKKVAERQQRNKEYSRYVEALRAQMREKIKMYNISLPLLCFCGTDFWDSHPDSCANNCVFYKNHKAYAQALQSVISSCNVIDGGSNTRLAAHTFATVHARAKNS
ncbi:coiled-coil domain-containing protein 15 isoform X1 [Podarcis raffonei]|uniref:coiled-coil domain-containing protein 15 isoform X1 n=1 Tax=Podarcis raffonei TaxID=65483 RepID=UPI0023293A00|nr:coiled-coil domain-containing protein 15 isoform X1 [Podarcis raffonei]